MPEAPLRGRLYMILGQAEEALSERIARHDSGGHGTGGAHGRAHFALNNTLLGVEELRSFLAVPDAMPIRMELAAHHQRQQESDML